MTSDGGEKCSVLRLGTFLVVIKMPFRVSGIRFPSFEIWY
jgi:hypothetical protein